MSIAEPAAKDSKRKPSINDVVFTITNHRPSGDVVHKVTGKHLLVTIFGFLAFMVVASSASDEMTRSAVKERNDELRPKMVEMANNGQDLAALWLVKTYYPQEAARLPALVAKGYPEAMFYQGARKVHEGDKAAGTELIKKAADTGFAPAIQYLKRSD